MGQEPPGCLAFLFCEQFEQDPVTTLFNLRGLIDSVRVRSIPAVFPELFVHSELVGERGSADIVLRFAWLLPTSAGGRAPEVVVPLRSWGYPTTVLRDPAEVVKLTIRLIDLELPHAGAYLFGLEAGGVLIAARRFTVRLSGGPA